MTQIKEDYIRGWVDCHSYNGYPSKESSAYFRGFEDCTKSYYKVGWTKTPRIPISIPASLWKK